MKKTLYSLMIIALMISVMPMVMAVSGSNSSGGITINPIDFAPRVWMCDSRIVLDDNTEPGRITPAICTAPYYTNEADCTAGGAVWVSGVCTVPSLTTQADCTAFGNTWTVTNELIERTGNYAFEGEKVQWTVLVMDKNKIDQNIDVYATVGSTQNNGIKEANCIRIGCDQALMPKCNARIAEERITECNDDIMDMFRCTLTVETPESMYEKYWISVEAEDGDRDIGKMDENEYWYFNPVIAVGIDDSIAFSDAMPGADAYSDTVLVTNDAAPGSGVLMDMFISGTDFYDGNLAGSGARCPSTNQLSLSAFRYFTTNGAYSTMQDARADAEGYVPIQYGKGFNDPNPFYGNNEIIQAQKKGPYYAANILAPGASMPITFKLSLPEPCNGDFDSGNINFWGEAI